MKLLQVLASTQNRLDVVAGLVDGILNALTLTSSLLLGPRMLSSTTLTLAGKVGIASASTTAFVFFVAHFAQLRARLIEAEKQLNLHLTHRGRLAMTNLGHQVLLEAVGGATIAAGCSLLGAALPLLLSTLIPGPPIVSLTVTLALLGGLGALLARSISGAPAVWAVLLIIGGIAMTAIGMQLRIIG